MRTVAAILLAFLAQAAPLAAAAQDPALPPGGVVPPPAQPAPPPSAAPAPSRPSNVSLGLRLGMYDPSDDDADSLMSIFDEGLDLEGAVGVQVHPNVTLEGAIGYYRSSSDTISMWDPTYGDVSMKFGLSVIPITASVRLGAQVERVSFSALAGVGLHMASLEADVDVPGLMTASVSDDESAFGFHLGGGVALEVSPKASIGLEIRRTFVDATLMDGDFDLGGLRIGATLAFRL